MKHEHAMLLHAALVNIRIARRDIDEVIKSASKDLADGEESILLDVAETAGSAGDLLADFMRVMPCMRETVPATHYCAECGPAITFTSASAIHFDMYGHTPHRIGALVQIVK